MKDYNHDAEKSWINTPVTRGLFEMVEDARWPMRISRAEFARRALAAYVAKVSQGAT